MSALPRIQAAEAITRPAQAEQTYPDWFVDRLVINPEHGSDYKCAVVLRPYNYDDDLLGPAEDSIRIEMDDIQTTAAELAAQGKPALAQALGAVLVAVAELAGNADILAMKKGNVINIEKGALSG